MAVNKNFVIKNGIEVDTDLIFADSIGNTVGIGTTIPNHKLHVIGGIGATDLIVSGISTFASTVDISSGNISGNLTVDGHSELDDLQVSGVTTVTNTTDNVLGSFDNGALQVLGGAAITKNLSVGAGLSVGLGLSVTGNSFFVGMVTFAGGTDGNITFGDSGGDNVVFNADVDSNFIPDDDDTYDLGSSSQQWRNLYLNGLADLDFVNVSAASTFGGFVDINNSVDISTDLNVSGVSTFTGAIDANGGATIDNIQIGISGDNEIDTAAGNLIIDSAGGTVSIDDNVDITGTFSVIGSNVTIDSANIDLGNAVTDTITATARFDSDLVPSTDGTRDLGSSSLEWKDLYVDGVAYIDTLQIHESSVFTGVPTFSSDVIFTGASYNVTWDSSDNALEFSDNAKLIFGTDGDLEIYHDGTHSYLDEVGTGNLKLRTNNFKISNNDESKTSIIATPPEGVELYYDGSKRFATSGVGVTVYDDLRVEGDSNFVGVTTTQTLHVGTAGTTLTVDPESSTFAIGSASVPVTATMNGGAIPSIGLVIALGG